jgi:hypothetical protein
MRKGNTMKLKATLMATFFVGVSLTMAQTSTQLEFLDGNGNSKIGIGFEKTVLPNQYLQIAPKESTDKVFLNVKGPIQFLDSLHATSVKVDANYSAQDTITITPNLLKFSSKTTFVQGSEYTNTQITSRMLKTQSINADNITATSFITTPKWKIPDYVFEKEYKMMSLPEVERYVQEHKHLPEVPKATEIEKNGMDITQMNVLLLKKVEELTLHSIALQKELRKQQKQIQKLQSNRVR